MRRHEEVVDVPAAHEGEAVEMPRPGNEPTASSLLGAWTDADTAMHIVGTSLGAFGALDPDRVLSEETPLRGALFDILLSLVEGGALEMRTVEAGRFAFRWRADYATAGLDPDGHEPVDVEPPSPHLAEIARLRLERDDALGRADFALALAEERERLLRLASVPVPATRLGPPPQPEPTAWPRRRAPVGARRAVRVAVHRRDATGDRRRHIDPDRRPSHAETEAGAQGRAAAAAGRTARRRRRTEVDRLHARETGPAPLDHRAARRRRVAQASRSVAYVGEWAVNPPSTRSVSPVTNAPSSDAENATAAAISSG